MTDDLLAQSVRSLFHDLCTPAVLDAAESSGWAGSLWERVSEAGLPWISIPEEAGGEGGTVLDALAVLAVAGEYGLPLPLAETGVLAGWLRASAGLTVPRCPATVLPSTGLRRVGDRISGVALRVRWARSATSMVALLHGQVVALDASSAQIVEHTNLAGEPSDTVHFDGAIPLESAPASDGVDDEMLILRGGLTRIVMMSGALRRVLDLTVRYVSERRQFGRPIGRFQAVQEHVVHLAQQVALLDMAVAHAAESLQSWDDRARLRFVVHSAKCVADEAAAIGTAAAHQAHGAMGIAREYPLHYATRRLWAWNRQWRTGSEVAADIGREVIDAGVGALWPQLSR